MVLATTTSASHPTTQDIKRTLTTTHSTTLPYVHPLCPKLPTINARVIRLLLKIVLFGNRVRKKKEGKEKKKSGGKRKVSGKKSKQLLIIMIRI